MIFVLHSYEIVPGKDWADMVEAGKKMFKHEKDTYGQQIFFLQSAVGKWNRVVVGGLFESQAAHEAYLSKLGKDAKYQELWKGVKWECVVPGSGETTYYNVIE